MKYLIGLFGLMVFTGLKAQSIVGSWQQMENKTCLETEFKESETEKELLPSMGASSDAGVAKLIVFDSRGRGQEGIFSQGQKKGSAMSAFQYKVNGEDLLFLDKKSGIITKHFIIDTLTESSLKIHDALKDCEARSFIKVK
jgi:hypothetical protein